MRVYHFTTAKHGLEDIRLRRLKVARIGDLNDPFEFLQVASRNPKTRGRYQYHKRGLAEFMGLLCFSANWGNPVQWSHYADRHRGICLGFDVAASTDMKQVRYVDTMIKPNLRGMKKEGPAANAHVMDLLTLKFRHWEYEQEHRLFIRLEEREKESGLYFFDFGAGGPMKLREIIVGERSPASQEEVAAALGDLASEVTTCKARLAFRKFEVVRQRNSDLWRPTRPRVSLRQPTLEAAIDRALQREDFSAVRRQAEAGDEPSQRTKVSTRSRASATRPSRCTARSKPKTPN
jgi:hypothetical protein